MVFCLVPDHPLKFSGEMNTFIYRVLELRAGDVADEPLGNDRALPLRDLGPQHFDEMEAKERYERDHAERMDDQDPISLRESGEPLSGPNRRQGPRGRPRGGETA